MTLLSSVTKPNTAHEVNRGQESEGKEGKAILGNNLEKNLDKVCGRENRMKGRF